MAVSHQASTTDAQATATQTFAHNSGSGSDRILLVYGGVNNGGGLPNETVDSATYNAVSLTAFGASVGTPGGGWPTRWFYLVAPATGSNNVVVNYTNGGSRTVGAIAQTYNGVDQSTPTSGYNTASGTSTTPSVTITSATGEMVVAVVGAESAVTSTEGAGQTERADFTPTARHMSSTEQAGETSTVMDCTLSASAGWVTHGVSLLAASAGGTVYQLSATAAGSASVNDTGAYRRATTATAAGAGTASVTATWRRSLSISAAGQATTTAALGGATRTLSTSAAGLGTATLTIASVRGCSASVSGVGTATATAATLRHRSATVAGTGTTTVTLAFLRSATAQAAGTGAAAVTMNMRRALSMLAAGSGTATVTFDTTAATVAYRGKYAPEHAGALIDVGAAIGFGSEHRGALRDVGDAGR